jgi:hypothetical protein
MTKTKDVYLKKLCNFIVDNFFIWNHLSNKIMFAFLTFKFWFFYMTYGGETTKAKVVYLEKLCNYVLDNFSFEIKSIQGKLHLNFGHHIWNVNFLDDLG